MTERLEFTERPEFAVEKAQEGVLLAALRCLAAERYEPGDVGYDVAEREYASEELALAARELYFATDRLPAADRPVGWDNR